MSNKMKTLLLLPEITLWNALIENEIMNDKKL